MKTAVFDGDLHPKKSPPPGRKAGGAVYRRIAEVLKTRILHGDYSLKPIPSERKLAEEFGINFMTVRRSLRLLEAENFLTRQPNGRLVVKGRHTGQKGHLNFAMLMPPGYISTINRCRTDLEQAAREFSLTIRPILYSHWFDPVLLDSVTSFDGLFLYPFEEDAPPAVIRHFQAAASPIVVLDHDYTRHGIPSIQLFPPIFVSKLLDYLRNSGHAEVGCFNTQSANAETSARINQWKFWKGLHGVEGRLIDSPVEPGGSTGHRALAVATELLQADRGSETAWLCVTRGAAMGMLRAMADLGLRAGRDLSVCVVNGEEFADLLVPSLTALEQPTMVPFFKYALRIMTDERSRWHGPLLIQPNDAELIVRESTAAPGPAGR